ncbi:hypothetical protein QMM96_22175 [Citrobacter freundii]|uniref:hypothetical protein n=1 Tax=Citrobacter freundii TaxID=546 RepID=UPI002B25217C|nr:hypothetical protein [Citrobacter freundii]MEB2478139.1 hypothetical protein [Citrobacter freundii]
MSLWVMHVIMCAMVAANLVGALKSKNPKSRNVHWLLSGFGLGQIVAILEFTHVG